MHYELIYTRCRQGFDMLRQGRQITGDGYKVYSLTLSLLDDPDVDLPFIQSAAQLKLPFADPNFMDEAYLYQLPESGHGFMQSFYPIPFDPRTEGDYSHRAGNYVNQLMIGDFAGFYPYELFGDPKVWNAKDRGEAYYYSTPSDGLAVRKDIVDPSGQKGFEFEAIGGFVKDGRQEALAKAVSFLIAQFSLPPEERKFLVIREENEDRIEKWIAAIECAFSPKMASGITFATRLEKFATSNLYAINAAGAYQTQLNFQDKTQKRRYRAMVVGVDERDRAGFRDAKSLPGSPYVLLDGKQKKAEFDAPTEGAYFRLVTSFSEAHRTFCREFLQSIETYEPSGDLGALADIYLAFCERPTLPGAAETARMTGVLASYSFLPASVGNLQGIYARLNRELVRFLQEDANAAISIAGWLETVAGVLGDPDAFGRILGMVCEELSDRMFRDLDSKGARSYWEAIRASSYAQGTARFFTSSESLDANRASFQAMPFPVRIDYALLFIDCHAQAGTGDTGSLKSVLGWALTQCHSNSNPQSATLLLEAVSRHPSLNSANFLFPLARDLMPEVGEFVMRLIIDHDTGALNTAAAAAAFVSQLLEMGMDHLTGIAIEARARQLKGAGEVSELVRLLDRTPGVTDGQQAGIFAILDSKLAVSPAKVRSDPDLGKLILSRTPDKASCPISVHLVALQAVTAKTRERGFAEVLGELAELGFPSLDDEAYMKELVGELLKGDLLARALESVAQVFAGNRAYMQALACAIVKGASPKQPGYFRALVHAAASSQDPSIDRALVAELSAMRGADKAFDRLSELLDDKVAMEHFQKGIIPAALEEIESKRAPGGIVGRITGTISSITGLFSKKDRDKER